MTRMESLWLVSLPEENTKYLYHANLADSLNLSTLPEDNSDSLFASLAEGFANIMYLTSLVGDSTDPRIFLT